MLTNGSYLSTQAPNCEHAFCSGCIHEWLSRQPTCPVDRQNITPPQLRPVPRILRNLLYRYRVPDLPLRLQRLMTAGILFSFRLQLTCDNSVYGCTAILKLDVLQSHIQECEFNPKRPVPCELGCGLVVPKDELKVSDPLFLCS